MVLILEAGVVRKVETTPEKMVEKGGVINFGTFRTPFRNVNILDAPLYSFPCKVPAFWKNFRLKEWQHFGIITPTHYFGMVIFDAKFMGVSFFYVYDRLKNERIEHVRQAGSKSAQVAGQVYDDVCVFTQKGYSIKFENKLRSSFHRIIIDIEGDNNLPAIKGKIKVHEDLAKIEPLVQVSPITPYRPFYTHKAAMPTEGSIILGGQEIVIDGNQAIALFDEQKTYYPYNSFWYWATAAGYDGSGRLLAFNLCRNMIAADDEFNENCFWIDGKIFCLPAARFEFGEIMAPWKVNTEGGNLDLTFVPKGERAQKINLAGLIQSDFHQPFGKYRGEFNDDSGGIYPITNFFGLAEHHATRY
jgi:hypothetical protein